MKKHCWRKILNSQNYALVENTFYNTKQYKVKYLEECDNLFLNLPVTLSSLRPTSIIPDIIDRVVFTKVSKVVNCWILTLLRWRHTTSLWAHQVKLKSCGFLQSIPNPNGRLLEALQRQILWSKTLYYEKTARPNTIHCCSHNWIKVPIFPDQHLSLAVYEKCHD